MLALAEVAFFAIAGHITPSVLKVDLRAGIIQHRCYGKWFGR